LALIADPWLAAWLVRVDVDAAVLGHAAQVLAGRVVTAHVGVENIVTIC
jgi:hypothetical protein